MAVGEKTWGEGGMEECNLLGGWVGGGGGGASRWELKKKNCFSRRRRLNRIPVTLMSISPVPPLARRRGARKHQGSRGCRVAVHLEISLQRIGTFVWLLGIYYNATPILSILTRSSLIPKHLYSSKGVRRPQTSYRSPDIVKIAAIPCEPSTL
jgi:hypothetical protein